MSVIDTFFNDTAVTVRRTTATPTSTDTVTTVSTAVSGLLRPITDKSKLFVENNMGKEWDYVAGTATDVAVGDDWYVDGTKYNVIGYASFEDLEDGSDGYINIRLARK